jgi:uncharacterized membrane protein YfcA
MAEQLILALLSGALVSFLLGLFGGGGSILALPLLIHVVGVRSPHMAIGISAAAVAANALTNLGLHARPSSVKWRCALLFAATGVAGAAVGSMIGKRIDAEVVLALFGVLMAVVGALMLRKPSSSGAPDVRLTWRSARTLAPRLIIVGFSIGVASGFFGIGGGFLITPALMWATAMPLSIAIGSSLVAVSAFGLTTAASYALSGLVDWPLAALFALGGLFGGIGGARLTAKLATHARVLRTSFAAFIIAAGCYIAARGTPALLLASSHA